MVIAPSNGTRKVRSCLCENIWRRWGSQHGWCAHRIRSLSSLLISDLAELTVLWLVIFLPAQDIDGGMQVNIYDSMAQGVSKAAVVIAFIDQRYQDSDNCTYSVQMFAFACELMRLIVTCS